MNTETNIHPYQGAYDFKFNSNFNGVLTPDEETQRIKEWVDWINANRPLTLEIYREMVKSQKVRHRVRIWANKVGGLSLPSHGKSKKAFNTIDNKWYKIAEKRAKTARKLAGWKGWNNLTSPAGISRGANDQKFGPFTLPGNQFEDKGIWNGILTESMTFII
jgi:hypothetical protein